MVGWLQRKVISQRSGLHVIMDVRKMICCMKLHIEDEVMHGLVELLHTELLFMGEN